MRPSAPTPVARWQIARTWSGDHALPSPVCWTSTRKSFPAPCHFCNDLTVTISVSHEPIGVTQHLDQATHRAIGVLEPLHPGVAVEPRSLTARQPSTLGDGVAY